ELQERYDLSYKALNMRLSRAKQKVRARVEKLLASINIFSWHDALEKMLLGGVEAVKISLKTKLIVAGIAIVMVSGGAGIFIWHSHQSATGSSETSVSQVTQNVHQQTPAKPVNAANTKVAVVDNIPKQETDKSKEDDLGKVKTDESSNSPTNANELGTDDRTPEQWEKYRLLTQLLPKYNELVDKRSKLQTEWEAEEPSKFPPPNDIPLEQQIAWVNQKEREFGEKWGKIRKEIPAEIAKIEEMLLESFPTAITRGPLSPERIAEIRKDAKIPDGFPFPTAPGTVVFDINRKELRKIVGGSLPMDKVKYVKVGDDWVPAD
ncbi:MAG: Sigma-70 family polymerase sigma factor, partial [Candidatus Poribacteria bacterium]|nr:Sigma-70 family polymerase sigma factor [Candidatus Poribacteria bacterium]